MGALAFTSALLSMRPGEAIVDLSTTRALPNHPIVPTVAHAGVPYLTSTGASAFSAEGMPSPVVASASPPTSGVCHDPAVAERLHLDQPDRHSEYRPNFATLIESQLRRISPSIARISASLLLKSISFSPLSRAVDLAAA